jgi:hypothetical protein
LISDRDPERSRRIRWRCPQAIHVDSST